MIIAAEFREIPFGKYMEVPEEAILEKGDGEVNGSNYRGRYPFVNCGDGYTLAEFRADLEEELECRRINRLFARKFVQGQRRRTREWVYFLKETQFPTRWGDEEVVKQAKRLVLVEKDGAISPRKHRLNGNLNPRGWLPRHVLAIERLNSEVLDEPEVILVERLDEIQMTKEKILAFIT